MAVTDANALKMTTAYKETTLADNTRTTVAPISTQPSSLDKNSPRHALPEEAQMVLEDHSLTKGQKREKLLDIRLRLIQKMVTCLPEEERANALRLLTPLDVDDIEPA
jgi:hypothetical protein